MDIIKIKYKNEDIKRKQENEEINKRKDTLIKKAYELGQFEGIDVVLIIRKYSRYTIYRSRNYKI
jgi:hypothetical protein